MDASTTAIVIISTSFVFCVAMICYTIIILSIGRSSSPKKKSIAERILQKREEQPFKSYKKTYKKETPIEKIDQ